MRSKLPKTIKAFAAMLCALSLSTASSSTVYETGNHLLRDLEDMNQTGFGPTYALGYIVGAADAYSGGSLCIPTSVTKGQLNDIVHAFLKQEPGIRHLPADVLVLLALGSHWACPKDQKKKGKT